MIGRHAHVPVAAGEGGDLLQHPVEFLYPQRRGQLALRVVHSGVGPHRAVPSTEGNQSPAQPAGVQIDCHQPLFLQLRHPSYQRQDVDELRLRELPHSEEAILAPLRIELWHRQLALRSGLLHVQPPLSPFRLLGTSGERIVEISEAGLRLEVNAAARLERAVAPHGVSSPVEQGQPQWEVWPAPQVALAECHVDGDHLDAVGAQIRVLDIVERQEPPEERRGWNPESALQMADEGHVFTGPGRRRIFISGDPIVPLREQARCDERRDSRRSDLGPGPGIVLSHGDEGSGED